MKQLPVLMNRERGIVICYLEETEEFVLDPTMTHTICIGSTRSGKSQTIVLPSIEQMSRRPIPSYETLFQAVATTLPKTEQDYPDFKKLHENCMNGEYVKYSVLHDAIYCQQSFIINDVKGELLTNSYDILIERGYQVRVINLEEPTLSSGFNPLELIKQQFLEDKAKNPTTNSYDILIERGYQVRVINLEEPTLSSGFNPLELIKQQFLEDKAKNPTKPDWSKTINLTKRLAHVLHDDPNSKNPFWPDSAKGLTTGMILGMVEYLLNQQEITDTFSSQFGSIWEKFLERNQLNSTSITFGEAFTPHTLINLFVNFSQEKETQEVLNLKTGEFVEVPTGRTYLDVFFAELPPFHVARNEAMAYLSAEGEAKGSIISTTANGLNIFADTSIANMTSFHEFNFEDLITQPTAYFIVVPDDDKTRWRLATIFVEQCYQQLSKLAKNKYGGASPRRINFLLDEFAQMPALVDFDMKTSMSGGRNIRWLLFMQSISQLKARYPQYFDKIIQDNCPRLIYIKSNDPDTLDHMLKELGTRTVVQKTINHERGSLKQSVGHSLVRTVVQKTINHERGSLKQSVGHSLVTTYAPR